ncbi:MAG TPA: sugar phosphorylase [Candidatus Dormibacteraeota bacterium]|jgi:sucrose phosphorylase
MRRDRLLDLYGPRLGERTAVELEGLLARFRPRLAGREPGGRKGANNEALLITYGDTLLGAEENPLAALREFAVRHLMQRLSGIHLLPFFPYSSDYGFAVKDYLAVRPDLGSWADIEGLHADFQLMFDFVLNHVSAESDWFQGFLRGEAPYRDFFITIDPATDLSMVTRPRTTPLLTRFETALGPRWVWTTFGPDQVDLDFHNPDVLLRMLEVMLSYVERGADLLRMDAVAYLWKEPGTACVHLPQTHQLVRLFRDVLDEVAPRVEIVTETNVPHRDNVSYFGDGRDEAQMVYQFPLAPLVLDAFARGDAARLTAWAGSLDPPSERTAFFNFLASHDGIGVVPARDLLSEAEIDRLARRVLAHGGQVSDKANPDGSASPYELNTTFFDALSDPNDRAETWATKLDRFICSQSIMLALAGVPGIYLHSLFGSANDQSGFARSGWKRDLNHQRLKLAEIESALSDAATHEAQVFARYSRLLEVRWRQPAFHPRSGQRILEAGPGIFAIARGPREGQVLVTLHNVTDSPRVATADWRVGAPGVWEDVISAERFDRGSALELAPYQVLWLQGPPA